MAPGKIKLVASVQDAALSCIGCVGRRVGGWCRSCWPGCSKTKDTTPGWIRLLAMTLESGLYWSCCDEGPDFVWRLVQKLLRRLLKDNGCGTRHASSTAACQLPATRFTVSEGKPDT